VGFHPHGYKQLHPSGYPGSNNMQPYGDWYHCNGSTYGQWLPGDPRGWRSEKHKTHVDGDYQSPPPEDAHISIHQQSKDLLKHTPFTLSFEQRIIACDAWGEALIHYNTQASAICIAATHWHLLVRCPDHQPRIIIGKLKTWSQKKLGIKRPVWAEKCRCLPISDEKHLLNTKHYILKHQHEGAAVGHPEPNA